MKSFKKILKLIATGSMSIFIAACYGMPKNFVHGEIIIKNRDGEALKGIKAKFKDDRFNSNEYQGSNDKGILYYDGIIPPKDDFNTEILLEDTNEIYETKTVYMDRDHKTVDKFILEKK